MLSPVRKEFIQVDGAGCCWPCSWPPTRLSDDGHRASRWTWRLDAALTPGQETTPWDSPNRSRCAAAGAVEMQQAFATRPGAERRCPETLVAAPRSGPTRFAAGRRLLHLAGGHPQARWSTRCAATTRASALERHDDDDAQRRLEPRSWRLRPGRPAPGATCTPAAAHLGCSPEAAVALPSATARLGVAATWARSSTARRHELASRWRISPQWHCPRSLRV